MAKIRHIWYLVSVAPLNLVFVYPPTRSPRKFYRRKKLIEKDNKILRKVVERIMKIIFFGIVGRFFTWFYLVF
jgi:hypothetical protein